MLKFMKNHEFHGISRKCTFFTKAGQYHGKRYGREIMNHVIGPYILDRWTYPSRGSSAEPGREPGFNYNGP